MSENIVLLSGAPRKNGNTERLASAFLEGVKEAGKEITVFRTADMKIGACLGCEHCMVEKGICIQKDDMTEIYDALMKADALVLVSPVYFYSISAQLKLAVDRFFALIPVGMPIKRTALLLTCGDETTEAADGSVATYKSICTFTKWEDAGVIIATGLYTPGEIEGRKELEAAKALGQEI